MRVLEYQMRLSNRVEDHHVDLQSKSRRANIHSNTPTQIPVTVTARGKANFELATITPKLALNEGDSVR